MGKHSLPNRADVRELVLLTRRAGWPLERQSNGHWRTWPPGAVRPIGWPSTPSDTRSIPNCLADLKRAGIYEAIAKRERRPVRVADTSDELPRNLRLDVKRLGDALTEHRVRFGLSQRDVAEMTGLHQTQISLLERAMVLQPTMSTLHAIQRGLGWTDFYGTLPEPEPEPEPPVTVADIIVKEEELTGYQWLMKGVHEVMDELRRLKSENALLTLRLAQYESQPTRQSVPA